MNAISQKLFLSIGTVAALGCSAAWADPSAATCGGVTSLQRRVVEHADEGMSSLHGFVQTMNIVHGLDMTEVKESLDTWRAAVTCQKEAAAAKAAIEMAKSEPAKEVVASGQ
jgi:hypothetical protein